MSEDGGVRISIASGEAHDGQWTRTDRQEMVRARWLVGADGANSVVQRFIHGTFRDFGYKARDLVIFADRLDPSVGAAMPDSEVAMVLPRPYVAWRESGKRYARWEFSVHDDESTLDMSAAEAAWELIAPWGFTPDNARLVRHSVFEFETVLAEQWRRGNVLLAGDAAHRMPPFQGQGMCSGQRDAAALAWRLDLVLRAVADPALLDSYAPERKPQVAELITQAAERGTIFWATDPKVARERDIRMRRGFASENLTNGYGTVPPLVDGFLMKGPEGVVAPAGQLSAQFPVNRSGHVALLDDHLRAGWQLITVDQSLLSALRPEDHQVLKHLGAVEVLLGGDPNSAFEDLDGSYAQWLAGLGRQLLLIRPDCYIFGGADDPDSVRLLFDSLIEQLHLRVESA